MKNTKKVIAFLSSLSLLVSASAFQASAAQLTQKTFKLGDVDLDGDIDLNDLTAMKKGVLWLSSLNDTQKRTADINRDGHVNLLDLTLFKLGMAGAYDMSGEVTVNYDENGNAAEYINSNSDLRITSDSYNAKVDNASNGSSLALSNYSLSYADSSGNASAMISPWYSEVNLKTADSALKMGTNDYCTNAKTVYSDGTAIGINTSAWGAINVTHDPMSAETAPFMRKTYDFFTNTNRNDDVFTQTGYGLDETVRLINAEVTKRENGIEFVNHVSDETVNSLMGDDFVTIDGVTLTYKDGEFTVDGIAEDEIELLHTMTIGQYDEIGIITNTPGSRYVYGLMYDKDSQSMAALVKVRLDKNAEATVIQYSKPADMATTINFYPKDGVVERAMANPDEMVTLFDTQYDPEHLVFQTVHFPRKTKNLLAGSLNARYQITNGITYKQTAADTSIKLSYASTASTLAFNCTNDSFSITNNEGGTPVSIASSADSMKYTIGSESFATAKYYAPNSDITYTYGEQSETFTPAAVLSQHTPFMY